MTWKTSGHIIDKLLNSSKGPIKDKIEKAWNQMEESRKAKIVTFKKGQLIISVENSAWLQELTFKREEMKKTLNQSLAGRIKEVKIRLGG